MNFIEIYKINFELLNKKIIEKPDLKKTVGQLDQHQLMFGTYNISVYTSFYSHLKSSGWTKSSTKQFIVPL